MNTEKCDIGTCLCRIFFLVLFCFAVISFSVKICGYRAVCGYPCGSFLRTLTTVSLACSAVVISQNYKPFFAVFFFTAANLLQNLICISVAGRGSGNVFTAFGRKSVSVSCTVYGVVDAAHHSVALLHTVESVISRCCVAYCPTDFFCTACTFLDIGFFVTIRQRGIGKDDFQLWMSNGIFNFVFKIVIKKRCPIRICGEIF